MDALRSVRAHTASPVELPAPVAIPSANLFVSVKAPTRLRLRLCVLCAARWRRSSFFAVACLALSSRARVLVCSGACARCASIINRQGARYAAVVRAFVLLWAAPSPWWFAKELRVQHLQAGEQLQKKQGLYVAGHILAMYGMCRMT